MEMLIDEFGKHLALDYPLREDIKKVPVENVIGYPPKQEYAVTAMIMSIRKPDFDSEPLIVEMSRTKIKKYNYNYHRLILLRCLLSGQEFYILTKNSAESKKLFHIKSVVPWHVGNSVSLVLPHSSNLSINGIALIEPMNPLIPITTEVDNWFYNSITTKFLNDTRCVKTFLIKVYDLSIMFPEIVYCCGELVCDGGHDTFASCPAIPEGEDCRGRTLRVRVSTREGGIKTTVYRSTKLGSIFMDLCLLVKSAVDYSDLPAVVERVMNKYHEAKIPFIVAGWYEIPESSSSDIHFSPLINISYIYPVSYVKASLFLDEDGEYCDDESSTDESCSSAEISAPETSTPEDYKADDKKIPFRQLFSNLETLKKEYASS